MFQLAGSLAAPIVGALLYGWLHDRSGATRLFDGSMYIAIPALVVWQVVPHAWADHGILVLVVLVLGIGLPTLIERLSTSLASHTDNVALLVGLSGLALHAFLEGAALVPGETGIAPAVILHRVLVGLTIWWLLRPRHGFGQASLGIAVILVATVAGYAAGIQFFEHGGGVDIYQAFVGGSLLHVVFHKGRLDHQHKQD